MAFGTRRSLQGRALYKMLDDFFTAELPDVKVRPVVEIVQVQSKPILVEVFPMGGEASVKFKFTADFISPLPEDDKSVRPQVLAEVKKLRHILFSQISNAAKTPRVLLAGSTSSEQAQKLVDELKSRTKGYFRGLGYAYQTLKGVAFIDLNVQPANVPIVYISWLSAAEKGSGAGDEALKDISSLADKHGVILRLDVGVGSKRSGGSPVSRLKEFYGRHGFALKMGTLMERRPEEKGLAMKNLITALHRIVAGYAEEFEADYAGLKPRIQDRLKKLWPLLLQGLQKADKKESIDINAKKKLIRLIDERGSIKRWLYREYLGEEFLDKNPEIKSSLILRPDDKSIAIKNYKNDADMLEKIVNEPLIKDKKSILGLIPELRFLDKLFQVYLPLIENLPTSGEIWKRGQDLSSNAPASKNFAHYKFLKHYTPKYQQMIIDLIPKIDKALEEGWVARKDLRSWAALFGKHSNKIGYSQHLENNKSKDPEVVSDFEPLREVYKKLEELRDEQEQKEHVIVDRSHGPAHDLLKKKLKEIIASTIADFENDLFEGFVERQEKAWEELQKLGYENNRWAAKRPSGFTRQKMQEREEMEQREIRFRPFLSGQYVEIEEPTEWGQMRKIKTETYVKDFPRSKIEASARSYAKETAKYVSEQFVYKNLSKLGPLLKIKPLKDIEVEEVYVSAGAIHSRMTFTFEGDSSFAVQNQIVYSGRFSRGSWAPYVRYPTTFHNVVVDGQKLSQPSEQKIYKEFSGGAAPKDMAEQVISALMNVSRGR